MLRPFADLDDFAEDLHGEGVRDGFVAFALDQLEDWVIAVRVLDLEAPVARRRVYAPHGFVQFDETARRRVPSSFSSARFFPRRGEFAFEGSSPLSSGAGRRSARSVLLVGALRLRRESR